MEIEKKKKKKKKKKREREREGEIKQLREKAVGRLLKIA